MAKRANPFTPKFKIELKSFCIVKKTKQHHRNALYTISFLLIVTQLGFIQRHTCLRHISKLEAWL